MLYCNSLCLCNQCYLIIWAISRYHLFWCSMSEISWSWHTQRTFWKHRTGMSKHCCFY